MITKNLFRFILIITLFFSFSFNSFSQTKPRMIINPYKHKSNLVWNTSLSKDTLLQQALEQDSIFYKRPTFWEHDDYANQTLIDYNGYSELNTLNLSKFKYFIDENGRFGIPIYKVSVRTLSNANHTLNAVLIGDTLTKLNNWYFFDNTINMLDVKPGNINMNPDSTLRFYHIEIWRNVTSDNDTIVLPQGPTKPFLQFKLASGNVTSVIIDSTYLVINNPNFDTEAPKISCSIKDSIYDINAITFNASDSKNYIDTMWFYIDTDSARYIKCWSDVGDFAKPLKNVSKKETISLSEGSHILRYFAKDIAGNIDSLQVNFIIDKTFPLLTITSPLPNVYYDALVVDLAYQTSDSYLYQIGYKLNQAPFVYLNKTSDTLTLNLKPGWNSLYFFSMDKAGNKTEKTINFVGTGITDLANTKFFKTYPNPLKNSFTIEYSSPNPDNITIQLYNSNGSKLETITKSVKSGLNTITVDIKNYAAGQYYYSIISQDSESALNPLIKID